MRIRRMLTSGPALSVYTTILLFVLAEIVIRATGSAPQVGFIEKWRYRLSANPRIGFEPIPFVTSKDVDIQFYSYRGASNSYGFRDREHEIAKPSGTYRILVLGDSVAAGLWIEHDEALFAPVIERELNAGGRAVEVLNLGVSGYNTMQEVETLKEKGLQYSPDLVVLAYCQNDRERDDGNLLGHLLAAELVSPGIGIHRLSPILARSALYRYLWVRFERKESSKLEEELKSQYEFIGRDTVVESLQALRVLSEKHGFQVLVAEFPRFEQHGFDVSPVSEPTWLKTTIEGMPFRYLHLKEAFQACTPDGRRHIAWDVYHPTEYGHECAGKALAQYIAEQFMKN